ncbi:hypothetical protein VPH35_137054 [Triticum aestivum]
MLSPRLPEARLVRAGPSRLPLSASRALPPSASSPVAALAPAAWPRPAPPRLEVSVDMESEPAELCVVRRSRAMAELEGRLHNAMVVYVDDDRSELSSELVLQALQEKRGIAPDRVSVHRYSPEDFLVVFARQEDRVGVGLQPVLEFRGLRVAFRRWIRQNQAVFAALRTRVSLELEGTPPAWELEVVESLLGGSCFIESIASETSLRSDLASFKLIAWTAEPETIPTRRWLAVLEPEEQREAFLPKTLQYRVLIHLAAVTSFPDGEEPWFLTGAFFRERSEWCA